MTTTARQITAKYSGKCTRCGGVVLSGTQCMWEQGAGVRHLDGGCVQRTQSGNNGSNGKAVTVTMGVFKKDGRVYVVKPNKDKTRVYAKEIVESPARMTESGMEVDFEAVYRPGVIYSLTEADRWDIADAQDFLTKYARCIVCGRHLKAAKSVANAIGPVCIKYFGHNKTYTAKPCAGAACSHEHAAADTAAEDFGVRNEPPILRNGFDRYAQA